MSEPIWLTAQIVQDFHAEQLAVHGGPGGIRDAGMLASALGRPQHKWTCEQSDLAALAPSYACGIANNHPFVDDNKRASLMAMIIILSLYGVAFQAG